MDKRVFNFTDYDIPVTIAGQEYSLNCSSDTGDYLKQVSADLRQFAEDIGKGEKTRDDVVAYGMGVVDRLLGAGAGEHLLGHRQNKVSDIIDLCVFLSEVAADFQKERRKAVENRAQRRAKR